MHISDSLALDASGLTLTRGGHLVGDAKVSRAGNVQQYYGREIGLTGDEAGQVFGVYRDPDVVFREDSMRSLAGRTVTRDHPPEGVDADNWKALTVGHVGGIIKRDGEHVVASMAIMDAAAVKEVMGGARCLSAGYTVEIVRDEGIAPDGTPYQFRQSGDLRFNHVAYLPNNNPRAGNTRIGDDRGIPPHPSNKRRSRPMTDNLRKVVLDGISIETTDQGAEAVSKLQKQLSDAAAAIESATTKSAETIATKDAELAKKDAEIDDLKGKIMDDAALDARVQSRADLIGKANQIAKDVKVEGLSDAAIRKAVVVAKLGDAAVKDKPEAYIDARFDILAEGIGKTQADPVRGVIADGVQHTDAATAAAQARTAYIDQQRNAWKGEAPATKQ